MVQKVTAAEELELLFKITQMIEEGDAKRTEVEEGRIEGVNELRFKLPLVDNEFALVAAIPREVGENTGLILRGKKGRVILRIKRRVEGEQLSADQLETRNQACDHLQEIAETVARPMELLRESRSAELEQLQADDEARIARTVTDRILGQGLPALDEFYFGNVKISDLEAVEGARLLLAVAEDFIVEGELEKLRKGMVQYAANQPGEVERLEPVLETIRQRVERGGLGSYVNGVPGVPIQLMEPSRKVYTEMLSGLGMKPQVTTAQASEREL